MKINQIIKKILIAFSFMLFIITVNSCINEEETTTEADRRIRSDINSYADLFDFFWKVMDENYNYFSEEEQRTGKTGMMYTKSTTLNLPN